MRILIDGLFIVGGFFMLAGVVGIIRMPDSYCRMQASTNVATLGSMCFLIGVSLYGFFVINSSAIGVKSLTVALFILFSNPVASHAIAKAARNAGVCMINKLELNQNRRDNSR